MNTILRSQIEAADELYALARGWQLEDRIMQGLKEEDSDIHIIAITVVKIKTVNAYYSTNLHVNNYFMAENIVKKIMPQKNSKEPIAFVNLLGRDPDPTKKQIYVVFASKFAHFFISDEFLIIDDLAEGMAQFHCGERNLGEERIKRPQEQRYEIFCGQFNQLQNIISAQYNAEELSRLDNINKRIDQYLWLAGQCENLRQNSSSNVNSEIKKLYESQDQDPVMKRHFNRLFPYTYNQQGNQWIQIPED